MFKPHNLVDGSRPDPCSTTRMKSCSSDGVLTKSPTCSFGSFFKNRMKSSLYGPYLLATFHSLLMCAHLTRRGEVQKGLKLFPEAPFQHLLHLVLPYVADTSLSQSGPPHASSSVLHPSRVKGSHSSQKNGRRHE